MSRRCMVTNKGVMSGNNVSHALNRTKRRFLPNLQQMSIWSDTLARGIKMRISVHGLRTIEHKGGLDNWLLNTANSKLPAEILPIKKEILAAKEG